EAERELVKIAQEGVHVLEFDVSNREEARSALERDILDRGPYFGIVCSAAVHSDAAFPAMSDAQWDEVINTNVHGFYNVVKPLRLPMIQAKQGGRVVALSSLSAIMGNRGQVNYSASKSALIGACKSLAREVAKRRVTVNCIAPGPVEGDMLS